LHPKGGSFAPAEEEAKATRPANRLIGRKKQKIPEAITSSDFGGVQRGNPAPLPFVPSETETPLSCSGGTAEFHPPHYESKNPIQMGSPP